MSFVLILKIYDTQNSIINYLLSWIIERDIQYSEIIRRGDNGHEDGKKML